MPFYGDKCPEKTHFVPVCGVPFNLNDSRRPSFSVRYAHIKFNDSHEQPSIRSGEPTLNQYETLHKICSEIEYFLMFDFFLNFNTLPIFRYPEATCFFLALPTLFEFIVRQSNDGLLQIRCSAHEKKCTTSFMKSQKNGPTS